MRRIRVAYEEVLQAHEEGCKSGQPLLPPEEVAYLSWRLGQIEDKEVVHPSHAGSGALSPGADDVPFWDAGNGQLWLRKVLLKEFGQSGSFQALILDAFQKVRWATWEIDDPLPRLAGERAEDAISRLRGTIKNLNRVLPAGTIRFWVDRTGTKVAWGYSRRSRKRKRRSGKK